MQEVARANQDKAWFVIKPFVLWQHSLAQTEALMAAAHEGKYFEMLEEQFRLQKREGLSLDELKTIATQIGMDADLMASRIQQGLFRGIVMRQRTSAIEAGLTSVPAVMINGRFVDRYSRTVDCLTQLISEAG
jgi:predicted DsbA family dithiol-disulfide isomerase